MASSSSTSSSSSAPAARTKTPVGSASKASKATARKQADSSSASSASTSSSSTSTSSSSRGAKAAAPVKPPPKAPKDEEKQRAKESKPVRPPKEARDKAAAAAAAAAADAAAEAGAQRVWDPTTDEAVQANSRFIMFIGNLSFSASPEKIRAYFETVVERGAITAIRMLTRPGTNMPKGCCFLEVSSRAALVAALQLHHTKFLGREINVELSAGGGGKGKGRVDEIQRKNAILRPKLLALAAEPESDGWIVPQPKSARRDADADEADAAAETSGARKRPRDEADGAVAVVSGRIGGIGVKRERDSATGEMRPAKRPKPLAATVGGKGGKGAAGNKSASATVGKVSDSKLWFE